MPVRSLNSSVLKWPDRNMVDRAVRSWSREQVQQQPQIVSLGYFGSYARGNWGVGSDLDLIAVVDDSREPFERRSLHWDLQEMPVPAEILVYTAAEWEALQSKDDKFSRMLAREVVWVYLRNS
jgi:predicted nucleotidyltransferase